MSKDGEEGYPGNLLVKVVYAINDLNELKISYTAETDAPTVVNLTNHTYFNLNGCKETVLDHIVTINADKYTEVDSDAIPTGKLPEVSGTAFDFRKAKKIIDDIEKVGGYDHNFVLNKSNEMSYRMPVWLMSLKVAGLLKRLRLNLAYSFILPIFLMDL